MSLSALQRVASGDVGAVRDVLDLYGGLVWAIARRFSSNGADAEDAVQEIFLEVWRSAGRYDPALASEVTFIAVIARRRLIDRRRRAMRRVGTNEFDDGLVRAMTPRSEEPLSDEAGLAAVALARLRPEQQQVLRLSVLQGLSHESISEATGLPLGTVKTHIRRGLIRIRQILHESVLEREGNARGGHGGPRSEGGNGGGGNGGVGMLGD